MRFGGVIAAAAGCSALALSVGAGASVIPGQAIDGPDANIVDFGGIARAPDGSGALAYTKTVGGVDHLFVARLVNGAWQAPAQVDGALPGPSSRPSVAAGNGGRVVVTFLNGAAPQKALESVIAASAASAFQLVPIDGSAAFYADDVD